MRDENVILKRKMTQTEQGLNIQRETAQESNEELIGLKKRVAELEEELKEIGDPNLFHNYKEMVR